MKSVTLLVLLAIFGAASANIFNTYDYIVVGVGQAGSVVAARLAEAGHDVLAIEGGQATHRDLGGKDVVGPGLIQNADGTVTIDRPYTRYDVPVFFNSISAVTSDWPMIKNGAPRNSSVGKMLGGSGAHNGMLFFRFAEKTVNSWGIQGWKWEDVLKYYKRSENATGTSVAGDTYNHGTSGPIGIMENPTAAPYYQTVNGWIQACNASGLPLNKDFNGNARAGCGIHQFNIRRGVRQSAAQAYLPRALKTGNLELLLETTVNKVLIQKILGKQVAYGVQYVKNGITRTAFATKEVIVSCSPIFTPKLLMLSGIGEAAHLNSLGIDVKYDNPNVGKNIRNNQAIFASYPYNAPVPQSLHTPSTEYGKFGTGPWSHPGHQAYGLGCVNKTAPCDEPDYMFGYLINWGTTSVSGQVQTALAKMRGSVRLSAADPNAPPHLTMNDFEHQEDVDAMVAAIKHLRQVFAAPPNNAIFGAETRPGPNFQTDAQLEQYVRTSGNQHVHWGGGATMGNVGSTTAVVDPELNVNGIKRLRVCDTSILPSINSHTSATAVMIGERCAGFILGN